MRGMAPREKEPMNMMNHMSAFATAMTLAATSGEGWLVYRRELTREEVLSMFTCIRPYATPEQGDT